MKVFIFLIFVIVSLFALTVESSTVRCGSKLFKTLKEACTPSGYKNACFTGNEVFVDVVGKGSINLHENIVHLCCTGFCTYDIISRLCCDELEQAVHDLTQANILGLNYRF